MLRGFAPEPRIGHVWASDLSRSMIEFNSLSDKKTNFVKEYNKLTNRFEHALIIHKLAVEYYGYRSFWMNFLPLTVISTATTIIGFLISGSTTDATGGNREEVDQFEPVFMSAKMW
jgi:hypothetical protein